ncbi:transposase [Streptomyces sp. SPB78]|nr:transposase [Streptomyces sp. SPB78]
MPRATCPHALIEWVVMPIVTREGGDAATPAAPPHRRARSCTCTATTPSRFPPLPAGYPPAPPTAAGRAARRVETGLPKILRGHEPDFFLPDGTLVEYDRVEDGRADYSAKHTGHGVNLQVVAVPVGEVPWEPGAPAI